MWWPCCIKWGSVQLQWPQSNNMETIDERNIDAQRVPKEVEEIVRGSDPLTLLHYLLILNRWRVRILGAAFLAAMVAFLLTWWSPRMYVSTATIFAPREAPVFGGAAGRFLDIANVSTGGASMEIIPPMIRSRRMAEDVIEQFGMNKTYPGMTKQSLVNKVHRMIALYDTEKRALYAIEVHHQDPKTAADIANFVVANLDRLNEDLKITSEKPIVRLLDPATPASAPEGRRMLEKMVASGLIVGLLIVMYAFLTDYLKRLQNSFSR